MVKQCLIIGALSFAGCDAQESPAPKAVENLHQEFDDLLRRPVRDEWVDYLRLRANDWENLQSYLRAMAGIDPSDLPRDERLAFFLNLYNASMISAVIKNLRAGYSTAQKSYAVFDASTVVLDGKQVSLNHIEHQIVRKKFSEPRIHVALVCGARSCPPLMNRAFTAKNLEASLERGMRAFVNDRFRNRLNPKSLELSQIFQWYQDDFGGEDGLRRFLGKYTQVDISQASFGYLDYSWALNIVPPAKGRWVQLRQDASGLRAGSYCEVISTDGKTLVLRRPFGAGEARVTADQVEPLQTE